MLQHYQGKEALDHAFAWRFWPFLRQLNKIIVSILAVSVPVNLLFADIKKPILDFLNGATRFPIILSIIIFYSILCFFSRRSYRLHTLRQQFDLLTISDLLKPEDLGFCSLEIGGQAPYGRRPHYPPYIPRTAVLYELKKNAEKASHWTEEGLANELVKGKGFLLIGEPIAGKSRTLLEIIRRIQGVCVLRPRTDFLPNEEALDLISSGKVILLLDDLNGFVNAQSDLLAFTRRLDRRAKAWSIAAACRDGPELNAVREAVGGTLRRFFEEISLKLALVPPSSEEKERLLTELGILEKSPKVSLEVFPTLGSICMRDSQEAMKLRFSQLPGDRQDCLRALSLLAAGGVLPFTHNRIEAVLKEVFKRKTSHLRDCLKDLAAQGFVRSEDEDPVTSEPAYLRERPGGKVVSYISGREPSSDLQELMEALKGIQDRVGVLYIGFTCYYFENYDMALIAFQSVIDISEKTDLNGKDSKQNITAVSLISKGMTLSKLGRKEEAIADCDEVLRRYGDSSDPTLKERVAIALFGKAHSLGALGRNLEEIGLYDEVLKRYGDAPEPALREMVAKALFNKGVKLNKLGRDEEAFVVYGEVLRRYGDAPEPALREMVAKSFVGRGIRLGELGCSEEAWALYDEVLKRYGDASEPELKDAVSRALFNKAIGLSTLSRSDEAIAVYDEFLRRYGDSSEPALREMVAKALVKKGVILGELGRGEEGIAVCDEVLSRYGDSPEPVLREQVAGSLVNKGVMLSKLGRGEEEIAVCDEVLKRYGDASEPELKSQVARSLVNKGVILGELGRHDEEIAVCDEVLKRYGDASEPELKAQVARSLICKALSLGALGRGLEEIALYDEVLRRYGDASEPALKEPVAKSLVNKGFRLGELGRREEAIAIYDEVLRRYGDASEPVLKEPVAKSLVYKGLRLGELGRSREEAIAVYDEVLRRYGDASEPELRKAVAVSRDCLEILRR